MFVIHAGQYTVHILCISTGHVKNIGQSDKGCIFNGYFTHFLSSYEIFFLAMDAAPKKAAPVATSQDIYAGMQ